MLLNSKEENVKLDLFQYQIPVKMSIDTKSAIEAKRYIIIVDFLFIFNPVRHSVYNAASDVWRSVPLRHC